MRCAQGYGTVRFGSQEDAQKAVEDHHGTDLEGRTLTVKFDKCAAGRLTGRAVMPCIGLSSPPDVS